MASRRRKNREEQRALPVEDYRHSGATRRNNPPAALAAEGLTPASPRISYAYSPRLDPALRSDPTGRAEALPPLLEKATREKLTPEEAATLAEALRRHEPWLEWSGKREAPGFAVDPVALHIRERVSTQAILRAAARQDVIRDLFADTALSYAQTVKFYRHDVDWANRLILGDSLQVMASLAQRENVAGKVEMIYLDAPYGIKLGSNFQPETGRRTVSDREADLTREPEMVRAYRDTWRLALHSYLAYARDRLVVAKTLLADTGSIFVQIGDENVHRVRVLLDEIFGRGHHFSTITYRTTTSAGGPSGAAQFLGAVVDTLLWYARDVTRMKYRAIYLPKEFGDDGASAYTIMSTPDGMRRPMTEEYCDVYGVPFSVIPFRGPPVNKPEPDDTPPNLVKALPEGAAMEIRFPVVEGYAFALRRNLIRCDIGAMEPLRIEPNREPTGTFVRPQVGVKVGGGMAETQSPFGFDQQDRQADYASVHLQTIMLQAAQRIVEELTEVGTAGAEGRRRRVFALQSRHALFPQVFRVVEEYVRRKVDFNGAPEPELGLEKYLRQVVERVRDAIQPDDASGEPPLLPLLNRTQEIGSSAGVEFRTKRPVFATQASHIGHVVADTATWEQSVAFRLEQAALQGMVRFYARNEGMGLSIPYEFVGVDHGYEPEFLVRMATAEGEPNLTLLLEVKGFEDNQTTAKHDGARRWVRAVNNWGKPGRWAFHVCRNPQLLERELAYVAQQLRGAA